ncbi:MAG: hypothetical protein IJ408_01700 [Clostridia bacterium]|nr:hypothetical protein [Clostridia bacterium]
MENTNVINDTQQTVVASAKSLDVKGGADLGTPEACTDTELAARTQSRSENSGFRKLRLENEGYKKEIEHLRSQLSGLSELENIKRENSLYLERLVSDKMASDLEKLKRSAPEITSLSELGEDFIRLIENGVNAEIAYSAVRGASESTQCSTPPSTGAVGNTEGAASRFFTSRELDRLTKKDLENPKIFKKAMESLKRL